MFTLNFFAAQTRRLQRSSEEGRSPQSRPVGKLALCRSGRPQNLLMWQESWVAEGAEGVFTEAVPAGLWRYFSQNQINKLLVISLNVEPTISVSCFNLHGVPWSKRRSLFIFAPQAFSFSAPELLFLDEVSVCSWSIWQCSVRTQASRILRWLINPHDFFISSYYLKLPVVCTVLLVISSC